MKTPKRTDHALTVRVFRPFNDACYRDIVRQLRFCNVLRDVSDGRFAAVDHADIDDAGVTGDCFPLVSDLRLFPVFTIHQRMQMRVPLPLRMVPRYLDSEHTAEDVLFPRITTAKVTEECIEPSKLIRERCVARLERQREEPRAVDVSD